VLGRGRVGEAELRAPAHERKVGAVLVWEREDGDRRLAGVLALLALRVRVVLLGRAALDGDRVTAEVGDRADVRPAGSLGVERLTGCEVVDEIDGLLALLGVGERRGTDV